MKQLIIITIISFALLATQRTLAQNLVPNPSFEQYNNCPNNLAGINYSNNYSSFNTVMGWSNPCILNTPDYFNSCAGSSATVGVPINFFGTQSARTGDAYVGIIAYSASPDGSIPSNNQEYVYCKLSQPLVAGKKYKVTFYVSIAEGDSQNSSHVVAIKNLGVHFSDTILYRATPPMRFDNIPYHIKPNLLPNSFLDDTLGWTKISGNYTASGGEQYMLMGRFHYGIPEVIKPIRPQNYDSSKAARAYYYIDDVSVEGYFCDTTTYAHNLLLCDFKTHTLTSVPKANSYLWNTNAVDSSIQYIATGTYWCTAQLDSCSIRADTFHVKRFEQVTTTSHTVYGCNYNGQFSRTIQATTDNATYQWSNDSTTKSIEISDTGTYFCLSISNCNLHIDTFHVLDFSNKEQLNYDTSICLNDSMINVTLTATKGGTDYIWDHTLSKQATINVNDTGKYICRVVKNCTLYTNTFKVAPNKFDIELDLGNDTIVCESNNDITIGEKINNVRTYLWNTDDTTCCISPATSGRYSITVSDGCFYSSDTISLEFTDCSNCLFMPTAFSPDGNGLNDIIKPVNKCILSQYELFIYNRFGELVFNTNDILKGWDGTYKNTPSNIGVYYYMIKYTNSVEKKTHLMKGDITLIR